MQKLRSHHLDQRPPFECIALLLQGGGALGAYQGGVYQALHESGLEPDWVAGISIGAINSAIIAGNAPQERLAKLRAFWEGITAHPAWDALSSLTHQFASGEAMRSWLNQSSASMALAAGAPGFFAPRIPTPWFSAPGSVGATSYYDTRDLKGTLERLVDFDRLNAGAMRLSVGAVNVRTGNFAYFDTTTDVIRPEHIMASGALPPGFPAIEIEGECYWDGGLISNTPLQWVVETSGAYMDTLAFQVDLWSALGEMPKDLIEVDVREKEIRFSSRTRAATDQFKHRQLLRGALSALLGKLPKTFESGPELELLRPYAGHKVYNLVELIYRSKHYEGSSKDYEFSRLSMEDHWRSGYDDAVRALRQPEIYERPTSLDGVSTFDFG
ncbi:patatin-like phospholipase family protein [Chelatococcus reniformis]|uniref:Membrane protein n=1 Tax=Chelatococcus reniformis TaxID=1494448 RepID=A0A916U247_9HYPH|nr:patatin-like phospholipase family protein [Chelatococcus reniformis]GGC57837.1 membrane protein [Chelatococcus reniformis]